jgi:hypothetical protein
MGGMTTESVTWMLAVEVSLIIGAILAAAIISWQDRNLK